MKLFILQFSPVSYSFLHVSSNCILQHPTVLELCCSNTTKFLIHTKRKIINAISYKSQNIKQSSEYNIFKSHTPMFTAPDAPLTSQPSLISLLCFSSSLFHKVHPLFRSLKSFPDFTASKHRKIDSCNILFTGLISSIFSPELSLFNFPRGSSFSSHRFTSSSLIHSSISYTSQRAR